MRRRACRRCPVPGACEAEVGWRNGVRTCICEKEGLVGNQYSQRTEKEREGDEVIDPGSLRARSLCIVATLWTQSPDYRPSNTGDGTQTK